MWQKGFISLNWGFFSLLRSLVSISHAEKGYEGSIPKGLAHVTHIPLWIYFFTLTTPSVGVRTTERCAPKLEHLTWTLSSAQLLGFSFTNPTGWPSQLEIDTQPFSRQANDYCFTTGSLQVIVSNESPMNEFKRQPMACGVFGRVWNQGIPELPYQQVRFH